MQLGGSGTALHCGIDCARYASSITAHGCSGCQIEQCLLGRYLGRRRSELQSLPTGNGFGNHGISLYGQRNKRAYLIEGMEWSCGENGSGWESKIGEQQGSGKNGVGTGSRLPLCKEDDIPQPHLAAFALAAGYLRLREMEQWGETGLGCLALFER